jgi:oxepin-CoA hydrolase/3-oxo-5,6-dehydrosuberyl-CoA semialdehyde dehydrogenase
MAELLESWLSSRWQSGDGPRTVLVDPSTEEPLAECASGGLDLRAALDFAREQGGPALRALSFAQRGELLLAAARALHARRDDLLDLSQANGGNTRSDAKFDVDGATSTLAFYGKLGQSLGARTNLVDGEMEQLAANPRYVGQHLRVPRRGVALHVNAFNFPAWGFGEKAAVALLAGMPLLCKPASSTALLTQRMFRILSESKVFPDGALSLLCGGAGDLLEHLGPQDVLAFTGSSETGTMLRTRPDVAGRGVRVNVEADSLNSAVLGPDLDRDSAGYDLFLREVLRDMTQKAGQKCTAIRRVFVPRDRLDELRDDLVGQARAVVFGDPREDGVKMGPVSTAAQLRDVRAGIGRLSKAARVLLGGGERGAARGVAEGKGFFVAPTLLEAPSLDRAHEVHALEVFGPVQTLVPYDGSPEEAVRGVAWGQGGLVASVYSDDRDWAADVVGGLLPWSGRVHLGGSKVAEHSPGPGTVLPQMIHGGPGRAGGGEELGGLRGLDFYLQRAAVQGLKPLVEKIAGIAPGGSGAGS